MQLEAYDIIMLLVLLAAIVFGAWKGLAWQLASLSAIFVSYFVAYQLREPVAQHVVSRFVNVSAPWDRIVAMLSLYLLASLIIWIIFGYVRTIIDRVKLQDFDRHAGAVLGGVKGVILCMIITLFAVGLLDDDQKHHVCCSYSGYFIAKLIDRIDVAMPQEVHGILHPYLEKLDAELSHQQNGHSHGELEGPQAISDAERAAGKILDAARQHLNTTR